MMCKLVHFIVVFCCFFIVQPRIFGQKILELPYKYTRAGDSTKYDKDWSFLRTRQPWIVFSDRKYNQTYLTKDLQTPSNTLGFLDPYYVVKETKDAIHIYKDTDPGTTLTKNAIDYGWIKKSNILLWRRPLVNKDDAFRKAILLTRKEALIQAMIKGKDSIIKFYSDPELIIQNDRLASPFSIFFIYKLYPNSLEPQSALLGTKNVVNASTVQDDIWGWVSYSLIYPWDLKVFALPNTDEQAIFERKKSGVHASIFSDAEQAKLFQDFLRVDSMKIVWNDDSFVKKYPGNKMRFPAISENLNVDSVPGILKMGFMNPAKGDRVLTDLIAYSKWRNSLKNLKESQKKINVIFVIDGTSSMKTYFPKISEALIKSLADYDTLKSKNRFRFGALIYRDFQEGDLLTEKIQWTDNNLAMALNLKEIKALDKRNSEPEKAVFYGLYSAIREFHLSPSETNLILLIGDSGNHNRKDKSQVDPIILFDSLFYYNIHLFTIQTIHSGKATYNKFNEQSREMIDKLNNAQYERALKVALPLCLNDYLHFLPLENDFAKHSYYSRTSYSFGSVQYCLPYKNITPNQLRDQIINVIHSIDDSINHSTSLLDSILSTKYPLKPFSPLQYTPPIWRMIGMLSIPEKQLNTLIADYNQVFGIGYTPFTIKGFLKPLWQFELFFSQDELQDFIQHILKLINVKNFPDKREKFQEAWLSFIISPDNKSPGKETYQLKINDIENKVFGLSGLSKFTHLTLDELNDSSKLGDKDLEEWIDNIEQDLNVLEKISNVNNLYTNYSFLSNEQRFFWIPQYLLP